MTVELGHLLTALGLIVTLMGVVFAFVIKISVRVAVIETKMETVWPLTTSRLANAMHQPDPEYSRMDALTEAFHANPRAFPDERLRELIRLYFAYYQQVKRGGPAYDRIEELKSIATLNALDWERVGRELRNMSTWQKLRLACNLFFQSLL